ncbi:MAG: hypothetical protein R6W82_09735 [bacterium]
MKHACEDRIEGLMDLLYGEGEETARAGMRSHLASCEGCRNEYEALASTRETLSAWPNVSTAPRVVYVNERAGLLTRVRRWADELGGLLLRPILKPAAAAVVVVAVLALGITLLDVRVAPDGSVRVGLGGTDAAEGPAPGAEQTVPVTHQELQQGLAEMASYIEDLVRTTRAEDRRAVLAVLEQRFDQRDAALNSQLIQTVSTALDEMDARHQQSMDYFNGLLNDYQYMTMTELQRTNSILASLALPGADRERE